MKSLHSDATPAGAVPLARKGFVLVSVLLIVALATILVVVASMMAQIERRAAANSANTEKARANALFALDVALNQLQTAAGPDQRVTARAEILDATNAPALSTNNVKQPLWTGVWKTGTNQLDVGSSPQRTTSLGSLAPTTSEKVSKAVWLVSGTNTPYDPTSFTGTTTGTNADAVVLAKNLGTNAVSVTVPLVLTKSGTNTNGAYAYWVSDEGVKAKVNSFDPTLGANADSAQALNQSHFLTSQASAGNKVFPSSSTLFNDFRGNTNLFRVSSLANLKYIPNSPPDEYLAAKYFPDATVSSYGVLADVKNGGLKKDLTAVFENVSEYNKYFNKDAASSSVYRTVDANPSTLVAPATGISPTVYMDGLRWDALNYYYNLYKSTPTSLSKGPTTSTVVPSGIGTTQLGNSPFQIAARGYQFTDYGGGVVVTMDPYCAVPLLIRAEMAISSFLDKGKWRLRLHYYPQMVLWNPFSVRLTMDASAKYNQETNAMGTAYFGTFKVGSVDLLDPATPGGYPSVGTPTAYPYLNQLKQGSQYLARFMSYTKAGQLVTMEPGEILVFGIPFSDLDPTTLSIKAISLSDAPNFDNLVTKERDMTADFSKSYDLPWAGTADGNATVNLSVKSQGSGNTLVPNSGYFKSDYIGWPAPKPTTQVQLFGPIAGPRTSLNGTWTPIGISKLNQNPYRIVGCFMKAKGSKTPLSTSSVYVNYNNYLPMFMGNNALFNPTDQSTSLATAEAYTQSFNLYTSSTEIRNMQFINGAMRTSWGPEVVGNNSTLTRVVLRDVPIQPMCSLGQFMHISARSYATSAAYGWIPSPIMFVGGSLPCISIPYLDYTYCLDSVNSQVQLDHSFLANDKLFDTYFFSTVPAVGRDFSKYPLPPPAPGKTAPTKFTDTEIAANQPLPNSRLVYSRFKGKSPSLNDLRDFQKAASNLMLDGAFNVNSTSVAAWKALLSSLTGNSLKIWNATSGTASMLSSGTLLNPIPRFWSTTANGEVNKPWEGMRCLTDDQITKLAESIVAQVKTRGPFLSMADFLNRRLGRTASDLTQKGALQQAIDQTSLNSGFGSGQTVSFGNLNSLTAGGTYYPANLPAGMDTATGIPGWLLQQDLVQAFSPVMAVRSDTFLVRTYGENRNPKTGVAEGKAWGEAVVQRLPDLMDDSQPAETSQASMNTTNQNFGRRFKVVSFRWLNDNEI